MPLPTNVLLPFEIEAKVKFLVVNEVKKRPDAPKETEVNILWFTWFHGFSEFDRKPVWSETPAENRKDWRALAVASDLGEGVYFEISYSEHGSVYYVDSYTRDNRTVVEADGRDF